MSRDFFDMLTDPASEGRRGQDPRKPVDDSDARLMSELQPALDLLHAGAPDNGIDLVPLWERLIEDEQSTLKSRPRLVQRAIGWAGPALRYAAVLMIGLGLGIATGGTNNIGDDDAAVMADANPTKCEYTPEQGLTMLALLQSPVGGPVEPLQLAAVDLAGCIGCHDGLARRWNGALDLP